MAKKITNSQLIGELGEAAVRTRFLFIGFQFDVRSRLEAGIDAIAEVMIQGEPSSKMIAVQVKTTEARSYTSEDDKGFTYLLNKKDLDVWNGSNLPVVLVLYRISDESYYWKPIDQSPGTKNRRLFFNKLDDVLDKNARDQLAALTVPKDGFGHYVPPLREGETALINLVPLALPEEIYVARSPHNSKKAIAILHDQEETPRFDWTISGATFWSFHDPRCSSTYSIVDLDQVEAIDTSLLAFHEDIDQQNTFAFLLRKTLDHQVRKDLAWDKERKLFYFRAINKNESRIFAYQASQVQTKSNVVHVVMSNKDQNVVSFVRHHAFVPKFECLMDQWFLMLNPDYHFTSDGFQRHSHPQALLSGKKRLDNNASVRGQLIMWHRFLTQYEDSDATLFDPVDLPDEPVLKFQGLPEIELPTTVPDDVWGKSKDKSLTTSDQTELHFDEV